MHLTQRLKRKNKLPCGRKNLKREWIFLQTNQKAMTICHSVDDEYKNVSELFHHSTCWATRRMVTEWSSTRLCYFHLLFTFHLSLLFSYAKIFKNDIKDIISSYFSSNFSNTSYWIPKRLHKNSKILIMTALEFLVELMKMFDTLVEEEAMSCMTQNWRFNTRISAEFLKHLLDFFNDSFNV